jgi:hypothetical protein
MEVTLAQSVIAHRRIDDAHHGGQVGALAETVISLSSGPDNFQIDLQASDFNGDGRPEFHIGERCSFYASHGTKPLDDEEPGALRRLKSR